MAGIWGNAYDDEPQGGLLGGFERAVANPLTLGGVALLSGEGMGGMTQGMQMGYAAQDRARKMQQQQAMQRAAMQGGILDNLSPQERSIVAQDPDFLQSALGKAIGFKLDPMAGLDRRYKEAQINRLNAQARGEATNAYGKTGAVFQGPDNRFYTVQFAGDGTRKITPLDEGMTPARGTMVVGDEVVDKATGATVRNVGSNIAAAKAQEEIGTAAGKATASAPSDVAAADNALSIVESLKNDPGIDWGTGFSSYGNVIRGTPGYDFQNKVDQAKSGAFLTAIQQMRGLGALSNAEGDTATKAVTRMNAATSKQAFIEAVNDYEKLIRKAQSTATKRLQTPVTEQTSQTSRTFNWSPDGGLQEVK